MKVAVIASLLAERNMNVNTCQKVFDFNFGFSAGPGFQKFI
ncbi:MAG: hypothetical protein ABI419_07240 [Ginsengibacter sp.]